MKLRGALWRPMRYRKYERDGFKTEPGKVELYSPVLRQVTPGATGHR